MSALKIAITVVWVIFWVYWLASAVSVKEGRRDGRRIPLAGLTVLLVLLLIRVFHGGMFAIHSLLLGGIGAGVFALGIALAVWARMYLGRNWGMPMTEKAEPELVTSGPYRFIRHPIYSGLLIAVLGTALVTNLIGLFALPILGAYFFYSAVVEEKNLAVALPTAYPAYKARTKRLIPFLL